MAVGNRDSSHKECTQYLTCSETQDRSSNLKGAWIRHLLIMENLPERQEAIGTHPGDIDAAVDILGSSSYHEDTNAAKHHFRFSLLLITPGTWPQQLAGGHQSWDASGHAAS